jgi:hypothetical protein
MPLYPFIILSLAKGDFGVMTGSKRLTYWTSETMCWSEIAGPPQGSPLQLDRGSSRSLYCEKEEELQGVEWNRGRQMLCDQVSSSHCWREA